MPNKRRYINEDITSNEVRSIVNSKLDDFLRERDFEKRVNELSAKVLEKFIAQLFNKRLMWTSSLKNESINHKKKLFEERTDEISSQFIQDRLKNTWDKQQDGYYWDDNRGEYVDIDKKDERFRKIRRLAADKYTQEKGYEGIPYYHYNNDDDKWISNNSNEEIFFLDDEYKSLNDLYNGVKNGDLLIHCRRMVGRETQDYIYPEAGETVQRAYGAEYGEYDMDIPELVFASDDFSWAEDGSTRNGIYFVRSDNFQRNIGSGYSQTPNGEIYPNYDMPLTVERGDWHSEEPAEVVAILRKKRNFRKKR